MFLSIIIGTILTITANKSKDISNNLLIILTNSIENISTENFFKLKNEIEENIKKTIL